MDGKTIVVTGGAGPNIGRAIARRLATDGATVAIWDVDTDAGREVVDGIEDDGGRATFFEVDVTDSAAVQAGVEAVIDEFGAIDGLVNNAGGSDGRQLEELDDETFQATLDRNLTSAVVCTRAALPHLKESAGSVVFMSSINALVGGFSEVSYASAKSGLHALCRGLTADYADHGIRFNVVCPGSVIEKGPTWQRREAENPGVLEGIDELYPLGRVGEPEEIADAVGFLLSERASWITGVVLPVDGGLSATGALPGGKWWEEI
jgi:NAD(P)-dependent dehydrogenase (short-subunit alcohol dehydrogenase family)